MDRTAVCGPRRGGGGAFLWTAWSRPPINSVAVLPFGNTARDPDMEYLSDGVADGLIDHLSRAESLSVKAHATVMRFKGERDPQKAARALGVP